MCLGELAARTAVATGTPTAHLTPSWACIDAIGRALLDDPALRVRTRLRRRAVGAARRRRRALAGPGNGPRARRATRRAHDPFDEVHEAELVEPLPAILNAAARWTPWAEVRAAATTGADTSDADASDADDVDELLLTLLDDGLLQSDLSPPIVGAAPGEHLRARLEALGEPDAARAVDQANAALAAGDLARGAALLAGLPGGDTDGGVHAVLVHRPRSAPTLERAAVERAAALAPLLVRLQDALAPPAAERFAQPALADALDAVTELQGGGAFDIAALATGDYGVELHDDGDDDAAPPRRPMRRC